MYCGMHEGILRLSAALNLLIAGNLMSRNPHDRGTIVLDSKLITTEQKLGGVARRPPAGSSGMICQSSSPLLISADSIFPCIILRPDRAPTPNVGFILLPIRFDQNRYV